MRYPQEELFEELSFIAYYFHWQPAQLLNMPHWERRRWCQEISRINERLNHESEQTRKP